MTEAVNLSLYSYDKEKAVDFLLLQSRNNRRRYDWILKQLEVLLAGDQVSSSVMYKKIHKAFLEKNITYYQADKLFPLLKKCDPYKATEYMLSVILSDESGQQFRKSETLPSRAVHILIETASPEDIPQLIEAHKQRTNTWHFRYIGNALVKAGDEHYIPLIVEDYVLSDDKRVISDIKKGTGSAVDAVEVLRFALYQTKPEWAYQLLEKGLLDMNCHSWGSLKSMVVDYNIAHFLPILEQRLKKELDPNNARKLRRAIERLRIRTKDEGRHLALKNADPYVVKMGLRAFAENPDVSKLDDIIELIGSNDPVIAISAVRSLNSQPAKFFSFNNIEPELLRSVILAYAGSKGLEECVELIQQHRLKNEELPIRSIRQCQEMLLNENDNDTIIAVQCLMQMPIEKETRSMILSFVTEEELNRFMLQYTHVVDSALAKAIKLCAPPEYGNIILPCITSAQFNMNGNISKTLFPVLVRGVELPENWNEGTDQLLTRLIELKPELLDILIELSNDIDKEVAASAAHYLKITWPTINATKQKEYLAQCLELSCNVKEKHSTEEWIHFNYQVKNKWAGFPKDVKLKTVTKHYLDGNLKGKPFAYAGPMARTGHIQISKLDSGKHTCSMETYYEFVTNAYSVSGTIKLPQKSFIVE